MHRAHWTAARVPAVRLSGVVDPYSPDRWHDFFLMVGGGAAALTGLTVVAMSLHLEAITRDEAHLHRARSGVTGMAAVFMRCGLVLMGGQSGKAVAVELFVVCAGVTVVGLGSFARVSRRASHVPRSSLLRTVGSTSCYGLEMLGAVLLFLGSVWGLYLIGIAMVAIFLFTISGAWLLLVGVGKEEASERIR
jgi:hypothetical protein